MIHPIMSFFLFFYSLVISNFLKLFTLHFEILKKKNLKKLGEMVTIWSPTGHDGHIFSVYLVMMVTIWSPTGHIFSVYLVTKWSSSGHDGHDGHDFSVYLVTKWSPTGHDGHDLVMTDDGH